MAGNLSDLDEIGYWRGVAIGREVMGWSSDAEGRLWCPAPIPMAIFPRRLVAD